MQEVKYFICGYCGAYHKENYAVCPCCQNGQAVAGKVENEQPCLLEEAYKRELSKPAHLRRHAFCISCPCPRCNPTSY